MTAVGTAPPPDARPRRHSRPPARPAWRRRADSLLGLVLAAVTVAVALTVWLVTVPVVGSGTALVTDPDAGGRQQVLILLSGADGRGVGPGTEVSVVWGAESEKTDGTVDAVRGPAPAAELAARYQLPAELFGAGTVVAETSVTGVPGARAGLSGTATAYVGRRPLFLLFLGQGVSP